MLPLIVVLVLLVASLVGVRALYRNVAQRKTEQAARIKDVARIKRSVAWQELMNTGFHDVRQVRRNHANHGQSYFEYVDR